MNSQVTETKDLNYKNGYVECACGWRKNLGNGFNGYHIASCPSCSPAETYDKRKVITGRPNNLTVSIGAYTYFVLSNGLHIQYSGRAYRVYHGLSERAANSL